MSNLIHWIKDTGLENLIWLTDVDETLLEKARNPDDITMVQGLEALCLNLDKITGGGFYVITGREFPWLDQVFPLGKIRASCEYHSLFRETPGAEPVPLNPRPEWHLIEKEMDSLVSEHEGLKMRKKPFMRSLHYSALPTDQKDHVKETLEAQLLSLLNQHNQATGQNVTITDGGKVFDMGPGNSDKSHAVRDILAHAHILHGRTFTPLYFGDSPGDLPAAREVQARGGKFIAVGDEPRVKTVADFHLPDPAACRALIQTLVAEFQPVKKPARGPKR